METGWDDAVATAAGSWDDADNAPSAPSEATGADADAWGATTDETDGGTIRLGPNPNAVNLRDALLALPDLGAARIDASQVERLPSPVFQILLIAMRDALCAGGRIKVVNPSFAFGLCFEAFGLGGDLEPFEAEYV